MTSAAEWKEPALTCPVIDAFIADQNPPQAVVDQLGEIRDINSQLRYGTWHLKEALATKDAEIARLREALESSQQLIDRIMHVYVAPEECTSYVGESSRWLWQNGGTLAAIAENNARIQATLSPIPDPAGGMPVEVET